MGEIISYKPEKLIVGVLFTNPSRVEQLEQYLIDSYGPIDFRSHFLNFTYTDYYTPEMGDPITRYFLTFKELVYPDRLNIIKIDTNNIEKKFMEQDKRKINLDPGLLSINHLILASTKFAGHRIAIGNNIYAELTLLYMKKKYHPLPWTYPDFRSSEYNNILLEIRKKIK